MSLARARFRTVLSRSDCTLAANIFDPLSARIAHMLDYEVCFLSGSVHKVANLAVPDIVLTNMSDLVDVCRRICRNGSLIQIRNALLLAVPALNQLSHNSLWSPIRSVTVYCNPR